MKQNYEHIQVGYAILGLVLLAETGVMITCLRYGNFMALLIFSILLLFLTACFFMLKVTLDTENIHLRFGAGFIRFIIPLENVRSCQKVRLFILGGWGVRSIGRGRGWSYSVSGRSAVELQLKNEQIVRIGTDDPEGLLTAIQDRL